MLVLFQRQNLIIILSISCKLMHKSKRFKYHTVSLPYFEDIMFHVN